MKTLPIQKMQRLAEANNGACLSKVYVDYVTPLRWECENGHRWKAPPAIIKRGH